jgi:hypothetical protein
MMGINERFLGNFNPFCRTVRSQMATYMNKPMAVLAGSAFSQVYYRVYWATAFH